MKLRFAFAGFCVVLMMVSCKKSDKFESSLYTIGVDECRTIQSGADQITICTHILHDSRCPEDVVCLTAGLAYARFTVTANNAAQTFTMFPKAFPNQYGPADTTINGFRIEFLDIIPHRRTDNVIPPVQKARLRITHP